MKEYDELREELAKAIYEFVHRGKTYMDWVDLPFKYGKKSYYEVAKQILNLKGNGWSIEIVKWEIDPDTGATNAEILER